MNVRPEDYVAILTRVSSPMELKRNFLSASSLKNKGIKFSCNFPSLSFEQGTSRKPDNMRHCGAIDHKMKEACVTLLRLC